MYIIKDQTNVFWGPKIWDKHDLQNAIYSKADINFPIQWANPNEKVITVNDEISIWPVIFRSDPVHNKKTQKLDGPFYDYSETHAEQYYTAIDKTLDEMKNDCKTAVDNGRKFFTEYGTPVTINGNKYFIDVNKEKRHNFEFGIPGNWKLNKITSTDTSGDYDTYQTVEEWVTLTQSDLDTINVSIKNFIQDQFDIIKTHYENIDNFASTSDVDSYSFPSGVKF